MKITNPDKLSTKGINNIVFDWGGVITNLDFTIINDAFKNLGIADVVDYFSHNPEKFLFDFEIGIISPEVFRNKVREIALQELSDADIDAAWNSLLRETPISRIETIQKLTRNYRVILLSNTNIIHAEYYNAKLRRDYGLDHTTLFEKTYYSHNLGKRKPNSDIFEYVLNDAGMIPQETLFIDDTEINIDTAAALGINSFYLNPNLDMVSLFKNW